MPLKKERCKEKVHPNDRWGSFHPRQCHAKIWKHGYCKIHHPDTVRIRQEAKEKRWEEEKEKRRKNNPILLLQRVRELEEESKRRSVIFMRTVEVISYTISEWEKAKSRVKELEEGISIPVKIIRETPGLERVLSP
jgi:hypothetical protein